MTIFTSTEIPASWCELRGFRRVNLARGEGVQLRTIGPMYRVLVTEGQVQVGAGYASQTLVKGQYMDIDVPLAAEVEVTPVIAAAEILCFHGTWKSELGGCGVFAVSPDPSRVDVGDPVDYEKDTGMDRHYHDCDEYWFILGGRGTAVVGDKHHPVGPGDCVAIGMGTYHDFPKVTEPVRAAYFETTLEGRKRPGHLWTHTNGAPEPRPGRG